MTTVLEVVQKAAVRTGLVKPTSVVGNTDESVISMLAFLDEAGRELADNVPLPELQAEYTFSLVSGTASYAIPADFCHIIFETLWNRNKHWPLIGPLTPQEWQWRKSGITTTTPRERFRLKGWDTTQIYIDPTPSADDDGDTIVFEYQQNNWLRPTTVWSASLNVTSITYVYYQNHAYKKVSGTTTGSTPPTHLTGSVTDGGVVWQAYNYDSIVADTDVITIFREELLIEGMRWRWKREKGLPYGELKEEQKERELDAVTDMKSATTVSFSRRRRLPILITPWSIPDGKFGS